MMAAGKNRGFCYMITFLIDIFCSGTLGSIPHPAKGFKFMPLRFYNVTVIDINDRVAGHHFFKQVK